MKLPEHHADYETAKACALVCTFFSADDEDEWAADDPRSCFNCLKRRWTPIGITCMNEGSK